MAEPHLEPEPTSFLASLGARGTRRAEPRASIAVAAGGCGLAILGILLVSGDAGISGGGDFNRVPGLILSLLAVAAGFVILAGAERGPLATAGAVAAGLGVPPLLFFMTFDDHGLPPYSTEGILYVSTIAWLVSYAIGPGRGRPLFLGAGLLGLWASALQLTEDLFDAPWTFFGGWFAYAGESIDLGQGSGGSGFDDPFGSRFHVPDPTTIGAVSLLFGIGYLLATRWLDRRGHHGAATPFALAALPATFAGVVALSDDLEQAGTGLLLVLVGAGLAWHGGEMGRRATTWLGGATAALGLAVFLGDMTDDATLGGLLYLGAGIGLVFAAHLAARALHEPDELTVTSAVAVAAGPLQPPPPGPDPADDDDAAFRPPPEEPPIPPPPPAS